MADVLGGASRTACPYLAPRRGRSLMWPCMECCCSFLSSTKATCFYFLRLVPVTLNCRRSKVRYALCDVSGTSAKPAKYKTANGARSQTYRLLDALCLRMVLRGKSPQLTLFFVQIWHRCSQGLKCNPMRTHQCKHASNSGFFPLFFVSFSSSRGVISGSVALFQLEGGLQKGSQIIHLHFFAPSEGRPLELSAEFNQIGAQSWVSDKCPRHFPLQTWDNSWKAFDWPSGFLIMKKQGRGGSQSASQRALEST